MNIQEAFNETRTTNDDVAYRKFIGNDHVNFLFELTKFRELLSAGGHGARIRYGFENAEDAQESIIRQYPSVFERSEFNRYFAMYVRDPRIGLGEREIGRLLMKHQSISIDWVFEAGRADDILYVFDPRTVVEYIKGAMTEEVRHQQELKKWLPREKSKAFNIIKKELRRQKISVKAYRKFISSPNTVESVRSRREFPVFYQYVPSLSMVKHKKEFMQDKNFQEFLEQVKMGKQKLKMSVSTPYDVYRSYKADMNDETPFHDQAFLALPKINIGRMIPIVDASGSMMDEYNSYGKAFAIGHYVSRNSEYMKNHYIIFSDDSRLEKLTDDESFSYKKDMAIMSSHSDWTSTNFENVLKNLGKVTEDVPDYILVLSDMQFNESNSNNQTMIHEMNNRGIRMIWWNLNMNSTTFPTISPQGNIFVSGYSPRILEMITGNFDADEFITKSVEEYRSKILPKLM